ncbi:MAG: fused response regulator/phosphatase [bacterium]|nr:fused response regulator/phosphatase [bacterium]
MSESLTISSEKSLDGYKALILIVDDVPKNIQVLGNILNKESYRIAFATDGKQALDMVYNLHPDLILLDIMMPEMDGYEVCRKLKESRDTRDIPIIFLTAKTETEDIVKGFQFGAVDYVTKPFNSAVLLARVQTHLELKRAKDTMKLDLELARNIQENILPKNIDKIDGLAFSTRYYPLSEVGGDIYDITEIKPGYVRVFLADATGHGVQAALVTMLIKSEYNQLKRILKEPAELLESLNNFYIDSYKSVAVFFTCLVCDIDLNKNRLIFASAGHPAQYLISNDSLEELAHTGKMIGIIDNVEYQNIVKEFNPGHKILMYTDGIIEEVNSSGEEFGEDRVVSILNTIQDRPVDEIVETLFKELKEFSQSEDVVNRNDDITAIGVERK